MEFTSPSHHQSIQSSQKQVHQRDPLTSLYDQTYLSAKLQEVLDLSRTQNVVATLALFQLENFYEIRTWVGKSEASLLLSDIARLLEKALPNTVLICRCEHYEFAALLFDECSVNASLITDRIKQSIQAAIGKAIPPQLELKCGVGCARVDNRIPSPEVLFARARHNLSLARYRGDSEYLSHSTQLSPAAALGKLKQALQQNLLRLSYQPLVNLREDGLRHYEIRCSLPLEEQSLPPLLLFETASRNALGEGIDRWIISQALERLCQPGQDSLRLTVSLTLNSLVSAKFLQWLEKSISDNGAPADQLVLQINEIDLLTAQHHLTNFCDKLQELGIKLTICNFGCTKNPFRYLPILRAHFIKLDNSMLEKITDDDEKLQQLQETVANLHDRGLRVITGMIEEIAVLPIVWRAKVNFVQGYSLQKPGSELAFSFLQEEPMLLQ